MCCHWSRAWILLAVIAACTALPARAQAPAAPAAPPNAATRERLNRVGAEVFSRPDRIQDSIRELKEILAADPDSAEGHMLLGLAYRTAGSPDMMGEAKAELEQSLALNPDYVPARFYLANLYLEMGRAAKARDQLQAALEQVPDRPQFLALLGEAERQLKNPQRSVELTRQALKADESFAQARYYLALALFDLGQRDDAIRELERVLGSDPKMVEPYLSLGTAYIDAGRLDDALTALNHGMQLGPRQSELRVQLARAYRLKGLLAKADEQLTLASPGPAAGPAGTYDQQQADADLYLEQGLLRLQQGRLKAASEALLKLLDMDPDHGIANRALAEVYLRQGAYVRANEYATRAEKLGFPLPEPKRVLLQEKLRAKPPTGRL
jgi:tetratricopeptide (TPR) repeat protein